ncbi:MAG: hypothetical protein KBE21_05045 [Acetoanaerobium sp.]|jgi:hypothetical protein|nr:hypothetical protein [Acetoanaerobium sp.]
MKTYYKKAIVSGHVIEIYQYEKPVYSDYELNKIRQHEGRRQEASEDNKQKNREKCSNRAARTVRRLVNSNIAINSKFLTLTFADHVTDLKKANYEFKKFKQRFEYYLGVRIKYLCVPEFTKKGRIHYHVVLFNLPFVKNKTLQSIWSNGFIKINKIDNCDNVGAYVSKYMTKDNEQMIEEKSYFTSRNLEKPLEIVNEKEIEILADSLSPTDVVYLNSFVNDYLGLVNYTQYNIKEQVKLNNINPIEVNW